MRSVEQKNVEIDGKSVEIDASWENRGFWNQMWSFLASNAAKNPTLVGCLSIVAIVLLPSENFHPYVSLSGIVAVLALSAIGSRERIKNDLTKQDKLVRERTNEIALERIADQN